MRAEARRYVKGEKKSRVLVGRSSEMTAFSVSGRMKRDSSTSRPDGNREDMISGSKKLGTLRSE
jgi:hypothetical protein